MESNEASAVDTKEVTAPTPAPVPTTSTETVSAGAGKETGKPPEVPIRKPELITTMTVNFIPTGSTSVVSTKIELYNFWSSKQPQAVDPTSIKMVCSNEFTRTFYERLNTSTALKGFHNQYGWFFRTDRLGMIKDFLKEVQSMPRKEVVSFSAAVTRPRPRTDAPAVEIAKPTPDSTPDWTQFKGVVKTLAQIAPTLPALGTEWQDNEGWVFGIAKKVAEEIGRLGKDWVPTTDVMFGRHRMVHMVRSK